MKEVRVEPDVRDSVVDFVGYWHSRAEFPVYKMLKIIGLDIRKFYAWKGRYGQINFHNGKLARDFWLTQDQKAIIEYAKTHETDGYRRMWREWVTRNRPRP